MTQVVAAMSSKASTEFKMAGLNTVLAPPSPICRASLRTRDQGHDVLRSSSPRMTMPTAWSAGPGLRDRGEPSRVRGHAAQHSSLRTCA